jgi:hypothetical protein
MVSGVGFGPAARLVALAPLERVATHAGEARAAMRGRARARVTCAQHGELQPVLALDAVQRVSGVRGVPASEIHRTRWRSENPFRTCGCWSTQWGDAQRCKQLRIVTLGFGTGRQKPALERWTNPKLSRRACRYGLRFWRGKLAGVAKRLVSELVGCDRTHRYFGWEMSSTPFPRRPPNPSNTIVALPSATRTPRKCGIRPSFKGTLTWSSCRSTCSRQSPPRRCRSTPTWTHC